MHVLMEWCVIWYTVKYETNLQWRNMTKDEVRWIPEHETSDVYIAWLKNMDSISYVYISWTIYGVCTIYIKFERGGPKFSNVTAKALA